MLINSSKITLLAASLLLLSACSNKAPAPYTGEKTAHFETRTGASVTQSEARAILPDGTLEGYESVLTELEAKVVSVDQKTRKVELQNREGEKFIVKAGPEIRNLAQVRAGDIVQIAVFESVDFQVRQPTKAELAMDRGESNTQGNVVVAGRAAKGERPGMFIGVGATRVFHVSAIDKENAAVTLERNGQFTTVQAKYPQNLRLLKVGDPIVVTASEVIAAGISATGKKG